MGESELDLLSGTFDIIVTDSCSLTSVTLDTPFSNIQYILDQGKLKIDVPAITQTPNCGSTIASVTFDQYDTILSYNSGTG